MEQTTSCNNFARRCLVLSCSLVVLVFSCVRKWLSPYPYTKAIVCKLHEAFYSYVLTRLLTTLVTSEHGLSVYSHFYSSSILLVMTTRLELVIHRSTSIVWSPFGVAGVTDA